MMNHCFLIMAHDAPDLLARIICKLYSSNHYFFVNIDKKTDDAYLKQLRFLLGERVNHVTIFRKNVNWGGYSQIRCELNLLKKAYNSGLGFDYFHLVSGHDYPCVSNSNFDAFFDGQTSYMHFDNKKEVELWKDNKYRERVMHWDLSETFLPEGLRNIASNFLNRFVKRNDIDNLRAGWQWFSWTSTLVQWVLDYYHNNKSYFRRFYYTTACDEMVFHSFLYGHIADLNIEPYNSLRFIEWKPKRYCKTLPLVLEMSEFDEIKNSKVLFCRKVSLPQSEELLNAIDKIS